MADKDDDTKAVRASPMFWGTTTGMMLCYFTGHDPAPGFWYGLLGGLVWCVLTFFCSDRFWKIHPDSTEPYGIGVLVTLGTGALIGYAHGGAYDVMPGILWALPFFALWVLVHWVRLFFYGVHQGVERARELAEDAE